jgi:hypothetical protein
MSVRTSDRASPTARGRARGDENNRDENGHIPV